MDRNEAKEFIKTQSPQAFLQTDKQGKGFICPKCNNGTGCNGDGIRKIPHSSNYKCFKCGFSGDLFDLIGSYFGLSDFNDQFNKAKEIYGIEVEKYHSDNYSSHKEQKAKAKEVIKKLTTPTPQSSFTGTEKQQSTVDIKTYIDKCHENASKTDYFEKRGISTASIKNFNLGYDEAYVSGTSKNGKQYTWKAIIIPTSEETYEVRNTDVNADSKNRYRKYGPASIFNVNAISNEKNKPICVCEGVIDALSIIQCGGQAIALGSAVNYKLLIRELEKTIPSKPLILVFDNDDSGKNNCLELEKYLIEKSIFYLNGAETILGEFHDANDRLLKEKNALIKSIDKAMEMTKELKSPIEVAKEEYLKTSVSNSLDAFRNMITKNAERPRLSTGFNVIDDALDGGLFTGLYVIGAISSLGKTTLTLQIADNLAQQGRDVLFFSLEQSKNDLISKSISRETYIHCLKNNIDVNNAKTNLSIIDGRRWKDFNKIEQDVVKNAFAKYENYAKHLFIYEGIGNISVDEIRDSIKKHIAITENERPIVFIDYLQILKACSGDERATDKQIIDHNITALKQLSRDFDIPIFAVSSLNRQNYSEKINMSAFKESGAIEYGSDVLIGLQLKGAGDKDFDVTEAKAKDPRDIELLILKNRNGRITSQGIELAYKPMFNYFDGMSATLWEIAKPEEEDKCPFEQTNFLNDETYLTIDEDDEPLPFD